MAASQEEEEEDKTASPAAADSSTESSSQMRLCSGEGGAPAVHRNSCLPKVGKQLFFLKKNARSFFFKKTFFTFRELLAPGQCPHGYHKFHNKCYKLWPEKVTFQEAIRTCK